MSNLKKTKIFVRTLTLYRGGTLDDWGSASSREILSPIDFELPEIIIPSREQLQERLSEWTFSISKSP